MRKIHFTLVFIFVLFRLSAQTYIPIDTANLEQRTKASETYLADAKKFITTNYKHLDSDERSFIKKQSKSRDHLVSGRILKGEWVFDARFDTLITSLVQRISAANSEISSEMKFHIQRDISLNAASIGNGYFLVNIGSFNFLQNDHQLASILAHEIGHLYLNHAEQDFLERFAQENSSDLKEKVDDINHQKYNKGESAKSTLKEILYSNGARNKEQELEADSIGYLFYRNAKFNPAEYIQSLKLLAQYDTLRPKGLTVEVYKKLFDLPNQHFKQEWLKKEDFSIYDYSKFKETFDADSLDDHPETMVRVGRLKRIFPESDTLSEVKPSSEFLKLKEIARYERLPSLYIEGNYGVGVYLCMYNLQENPQDTYSKKWLGQFFSGIAKARKEYTLNRYLDRISPKVQSESYQQFLSFMWNLSLPELLEIEKFYTKKESM